MTTKKYVEELLIDETEVTADAIPSQSYPARPERIPSMTYMATMMDLLSHAFTPQFDVRTRREQPRPSTSSMKTRSKRRKAVLKRQR